MPLICSNLDHSIDFAINNRRYDGQ